MSVNKAILIGNLGREPEIRHTQSGDAVASLSVATSESWKDKNSGERKEKTEWHRISVFGPTAEACGRYLKKGSKVYIEGAIETRKWTDQSGQDKYTTEIIVRGWGGRVEFLDPKQSDGGSHPADRGQQGPSGAGDLSDEIPW